jgi:hypothetical protein
MAGTRLQSTRPVGTAVNILIAAVGYFLGYAAAYGVGLLLRIFFPPTWGGEALISFWFIFASSIPGLCVAMLLSARLSLGPAFAVGLVAMLVTFPALLSARLVCDLLSAKSFAVLFSVYGILCLIGSYLAARVILLLATRA